MPIFSDLGRLSIEIQVRTLAQHIWAAASHKLQYKHEQAVPPPLRRTIHRVSALLETVDLEFERVLQERGEYIGSEISTLTGAERLDVDILDFTLRKLFPIENREDPEFYDELLYELFSLGIFTANQLKEVILRHRDQVLVNDKVFASNPVDGDDADIERIKRGIYFTFAGLTRQALGMEFGERYNRVLQDKSGSRAAKKLKAKGKRS